MAIDKDFVAAHRAAVNDMHESFRAGKVSEAEFRAWFARQGMLPAEIDREVAFAKSDLKSHPNAVLKPIGDRLKHNVRQGTMDAIEEAMKLSAGPASAYVLTMVSLGETLRFAASTVCGFRAMKRGRLDDATVPNDDDLLICALMAARFAELGKSTPASACAQGAVQDFIKLKRRTLDADTLDLLGLTPTGEIKP